MDSDKLADTGGESPSERRRLTATGLKRTEMDGQKPNEFGDGRRNPRSKPEAGGERPAKAGDEQ